MKEGKRWRSKKWGERENDGDRRKMKKEDQRKKNSKGRKKRSYESRIQVGPEERILPAFWSQRAQIWSLSWSSCTRGYCVRAFQSININICSKGVSSSYLIQWQRSCFRIYQYSHTFFSSCTTPRGVCPIFRLTLRQVMKLSYYEKF